MTDKPEKRPPVDWEAIERDYRAGILSVVEIARQHGLSHTAINKRAKAKGWTRDLAPRIRREVSARIVSAEVAAEVSEKRAAETETIVERAVAVQVAVVRDHQKRIKRASAIGERLMEQLSEALENREEIEGLIELVTVADRTSNRRNAMLKAVSLPTHAGVLKDLAACLKVFVDLERVAFGINGSGEDEKPVQTSFSDVDLARRVAFMLAKGREAMKQGEG